MFLMVALRLRKTFRISKENWESGASVAGCQGLEMDPVLPPLKCACSLQSHA